MDKTERIIAKANELGHMLKQHELVQRFEELSQQLEKSDASRMLLNECVGAAETIRAKELEGKPIEVEEKQQMQALEEKVQADSLLQEFSATQHYYMQFLTQVNQAIANPTGEPPKESNIVLPGEDSKIIMP